MEKVWSWLGLLLGRFGVTSIGGPRITVNKIGLGNLQIFLVLGCPLYDGLKLRKEAAYLALQPQFPVIPLTPALSHREREPSTFS